MCSISNCQDSDRYRKFLNLTKLGSTITATLFQGAVVNFKPLTNQQNLGPTLSGFFNPANCNGSNCLAGFLNAAFTMALALGAILAVLRLAYAGWLYMGAADMWGSKQHAKEVIMNAILGLLLLIGIYIVLAQINPNLLNLNVLQSIH